MNEFVRARVATVRALGFRYDAARSLGELSS